MAKQTDFNKFLSNIEPSPTTVSYISSIQTNLREYLKNHEEYKKFMLIRFFLAHMQNIHLYVRS